MSQCEQILGALRRGPITAVEAYMRFGCLRLAARVAELRHRGHQIHSVMVPLPNHKRVARYHLVRSRR